MKNITIIVVTILYSFQLTGQTIHNPLIRKSEVSYCEIQSITLSTEKTVVNFNYISPNTYKNGGWVCAGDNFFIRDNETGRKYFLTKAIGIPICPEKHQFRNIGESLNFKLEFQPVPSSCNEIDIIENLSGKGFNYYGVSLKNKEKIINQTNESIVYYSTLKKEGKMRTENNALSEIIYKIPSGTKVGVYSKEKGYYKINYNGIIGYLSELYIGDYKTTQKPKDKKREIQKKEIKTAYKDGSAYLYYVHNGISVTMTLTIEQKYGKYYIAYIAIENFSGKAFDFNPENIYARLVKNGITKDGQVLSHSEYIKKVGNRQAWNSALVAFGESYSASQAGYSSSSTNSTTTGFSNSYGSASGYYGNSYGSIYGSSSMSGTSTTRSNTQSYDGAANYAAQQNAQNNISNYQNQQYQIKDEINQGYLKRNTIYHQQRIFGAINIKFSRVDNLEIIVPVNGEDYVFPWK